MSSTIIRFKGLFDVEIPGYPEENIDKVKKILDNSYITNGKQDINICNKYNSFNNFPIAFLNEFSKTEYKTESKHPNGETREYIPSYYIYPLNHFETVDWIFYKGDPLPMWKTENGNLKKWHREMSFHGAFSIKMDYKETIDIDDDNYIEEDRTYNTIEDILKFKHFYYKRYNELNNLTELDFKAKYTRRAPTYSKAYLDIFVKDIRFKSPVAKLALVNEKAIQKISDMNTDIEVYTSGSKYGIKVNLNKKGKNTIRYKKIKNISLKKLITKLHDKRMLKYKYSKKINMETNKTSFWYSGYIRELNDFTITRAVDEMILHIT